MSELALHYRLLGQRSMMNAFAWSSDGMMLAAACPSSGTIQLWDTRTQKSLDPIKDEPATLYCPTWRPGSKTLITAGSDGKIKYWDVETGQHQHTSTEYGQRTICLACSPEMVASGSSDGTIRLWDALTGQHCQTLSRHHRFVSCLVWSSDGTMLASGSADKSIKIWTRNKRSGNWQLSKELNGHFEAVTSLACLREKSLIISGSEDKTIRGWNIDTGQEIWRVEAHTAAVTNLSLSSDGKMFASQADNIRIWSTDTPKFRSKATPNCIFNVPLPALKPLFMMAEETASRMVAFHPRQPYLALFGEQCIDINVHDINGLRRNHFADFYTYTSAKIILVGDTGVGKTALGYVLMGLGFQLTDSTHNRTIWSFHSDEVESEDGTPGQHEIFLWDLAGQPSYRMIHQLNLKDVAVALIIFDARSETDPFSGVDYWRRASRRAESIQNTLKSSMKKFLVAARIDNGSPMVTRERIEAFISGTDTDGHFPAFDAYFETSAKEGKGITELAAAIIHAIDWNQLPIVKSPHLFQHIKAFLRSENERGSEHLLTSSKDLYRTFVLQNPDLDQSNDLYKQFEVCIQSLESQGLIRRFNFGNLVLLQPELLDTYAAALILFVRREPDGPGDIREGEVKECKFSEFIPREKRIQDKDDESLLVIAMIEDLVSREIALRDTSNDGTFLVFPGQSTREYPNMPDPDGQAVIFSFEGPILNIYATLAVRLSHSGLFKRVGQWKNAMTYTTNTTASLGVYGIMLKNYGDGRADLILFFDTNAREELRFHFEQFIKSHLERDALPESLHRRRIFQCSRCKTPVTDDQVRRRRELGYTSLKCPVCEVPISLSDGEELFTGRVPEMDLKADQNRERSKAEVTLQGKIATRDYDVFFCYNKVDREDVKKIGSELRKRNVLPWDDESDVQPGLLLKEIAARKIQDIKAIAVFIGKDGIEEWQQLLVDTSIGEFARRKSLVIPVILPQAQGTSAIPRLLENFSWVDFREKSPDPMERLIWGITGQRSENIYEMD